MVATSKGKGLGVRFLREHLSHSEDGCLIWPMFINPKGYGILGYNGKMWRAHRLMCVLAHGEPPTTKHEAAHSCGNRSCVNPKHLRWGTSRENHLDQRTHGTSKTSRYGNRGALNSDQVKAIRKMEGRATQAAVAKQFGVSEETIRKVQIRLTYRRIA